MSGKKIEEKRRDRTVLPSSLEPKRPGPLEDDKMTTRLPNEARRGIYSI